MLLCSVTILVFLIWMSVSDIRTRTIPPLPPLLLLLFGLLFHSIRGDLGIAELTGGLLLGGALLLISRLTHSMIGEGDALVVLACGACIGFSGTFAVLTAGLLLCSLCSVILLLRKKVSRSDTLPFLPFLAAGNGLVLLLSLITGL